MLTGLSGEVCPLLQGSDSTRRASSRGVPFHVAIEVPFLVAISMPGTSRPPLFAPAVPRGEFGRREPGRAQSRFPGAVCRHRWTVRLGEVEPVFGQTGRVVLDIRQRRRRKRHPSRHQSPHQGRIHLLATGERRRGSSPAVFL